MLDERGSPRFGLDWDLADQFTKVSVSFPGDDRRARAPLRQELFGALVVGLNPVAVGDRIVRELVYRRSNEGDGLVKPPVAL